MALYSSDTLAFALLRLLSDGEFHSGARLAALLGLSRTRIWQAIQRCADWGIEVYRVSGRGYCLATPLSLLSAERINAELGVKASSWQLDIVDIAGSTNTKMMQDAATGNIHGKVLIAELQTAGRGRLGRTWNSAIGSSLTLSVGWRFQQGVGALVGLSLAVGVALVRAVSALGVSEAKLKWPNDLLCQNRKLGGILTEVHGDALGPSSVVIGVGLNVQLSGTLQAQIDQPSIDLAQSHAATLDRNAILAMLLVQLYDVLTEYAHHGFAAFRSEWQRHHAFQNQSVRLMQSDGKEIRGIVCGVDANGALLIDTDSGRERVHSGEISLRPISTLSSAGLQ